MLRIDSSNGFSVTLDEGQLEDEEEMMVDNMEISAADRSSKSTLSMLIRGVSMIMFIKVYVRTEHAHKGCTAG